MTEELILTNLIENEAYTRKVLPFLKKSYFQDRVNRFLFEQYVRYFVKYNVPPTLETLGIISLDANVELDSDDIAATLDDLNQDEKPHLDWLIDITEDFCKERALFNAVQQSINIIEGEDDKNDKHAIPNILQKALSVTFDTHVGHDYFEDAEERFEFYHLDHPRIKFNINILNKITNGGVPRKTLNSVMGDTNVGKSLVLCALAADYLTMGYNVLYVSFEMSEEAISNRIDANKFDIPLNDVEKLDYDAFMSKLNGVKSKTQGRLIIKEYPTSSAHVGHIEALLDELKTKKGFIPDIVMVDYINIMASSRVKLSNTNSYFYIKSIAEELRGMAVKNNLIVWTATQSNRDASKKSDMELANTSESYGFVHSLDFFLGLIRTEELDEMGQILIKQLKSRYGNKNYYEKFCLGIDVDKFKLYDLDTYDVTNKETHIEHKQINNTRNIKEKIKNFKL